MYDVRTSHHIHMYVCMYTARMHLLVFFGFFFAGLTCKTCLERLLNWQMWSLEPVIWAESVSSKVRVLDLAKLVHFSLSLSISLSLSLSFFLSLEHNTSLTVHVLVLVWILFGKSVLQRSLNIETA